MINRYASLRQGLVGCWIPSLGASGFRLIDRSGNNNHGTLTNMDPGTDWVPSGGKLALDFDGVNDRISLQNAVITRTATCSLWIKPRASNFVAIGGAGSNYFLYYDGTFIYYSVPPASYVGIAYTFPAEWTFFTVTRSDRVITFFINGVQVGTQQSLGSDVDMTVDSIGSYNTSLFPANAQLDDVRIYNRALTPSEIRLLYIGGRGVGLMPERIKHRRKTTAAASNRRRRLICGANC